MVRGRLDQPEFARVGKILQQDSTIATGAGHHSVLHAPGSSHWYIVYHRRPLGETDANHRVVSIDELRFDASGRIEPVVITTAGVRADPLPPAFGGRSTAANTGVRVPGLRGRGPPRM